MENISLFYGHDIDRREGGCEFGCVNMKCPQKIEVLSLRNTKIKNSYSSNLFQNLTISEAN